MLGIFCYILNDNKNHKTMLTNIIFEIKMFLFIMAMFVSAIGILHTIIVFNFKRGKLFPSENKVIVFLCSIAYIITMLICGFGR